jgi:hypothetical protein
VSLRTRGTDRCLASRCFASLIKTCHLVFQLRWPFGEILGILKLLAVRRDSQGRQEGHGSVLGSRDTAGPTTTVIRRQITVVATGDSYI